MVLVAVIIGYLLGAIPFVVPKFIELNNKKTQAIEDIKENQSQAEILDEWLNGKKENNSTQVNQQDIYEEYITGITTKGE